LRIVQFLNKAESLTFNFTRWLLTAVKLSCFNLAGCWKTLRAKQRQGKNGRKPAVYAE